jgi:hypothetical protein
MKRAIFALALLTVFNIIGRGQNQPAVEWELVNPFPFIHEQKYIDELRAVYKALPPPSPAPSPGTYEKNSSGLERALQKIADDRIKQERPPADVCNNHPAPDVQKKCRTPYAGWFATVAANKYGATCWDPVNRKYRNDGPCVNYINPTCHRVRVWVPGARVVAWLKDGAPLAVTAPSPCDKRSEGENSIVFDLPYDPDGKDWMVSARLSDGAVTPEVPVRVENRLVVGLGDSFAAGEGNPDIPAKFTAGRTDVDFLYRLEVRRNPQRDRDGAAGWLDERCHRSMYSYQFKTALRMALENPREAVTFVSFSCSGAVTPELIDKQQKPREVNSNRAKIGKLQPQLDALRETLGYTDRVDPRTIDYLLLSTGGNDIGFARYVSYLINTGFVKWVYAKTPKEKKTEEKIRETLFKHRDGTPGNYLQLQKAIFSPRTAPKKNASKVNPPRVIAPLKIRDCKAAGPCDRILLTVYPSPLQEGDGPAKLCRAVKFEFDVPFKKDDDRARRIGIGDKFLIEPLQRLQQDEVKANNLGWTVVTGHLRAFLDHGFCAQGGASESGNAEEFVMPKRDDHMWQKFDPWEYRVYEKRQRWIKLPIDSKLSTDQTHIFRTFSFDLFFEDDRANIMHPTAEGLAAMADANFKAIVDLKK